MHTRWLAGVNVITVALLLLVVAGCSPAQALVEMPEYAPDNQTKCRVAKSQMRPLIVEWPSSDRATLQAKAKYGIVLVRYDGCSMDLLVGCEVTGRYKYTGVTQQDDRLSIRSADELYASIPVHAASFESKLSTHGQLTVEMSTVGRYTAIPDERALRSATEGRCAAATHLVEAMTIGAFSFYAGAGATVGARLEVLEAKVGGSSDAAREVLNRGGDMSACGESRPGREGPPSGCGSVVRLELRPLERSQPRVATWRAPSLAETDEIFAAQLPQELVEHLGMPMKKDGDTLREIVERCEAAHEAAATADRAKATRMLLACIKAGEDANGEMRAVALRARAGADLARLMIAPVRDGIDLLHFMQDEIVGKDDLDLALATLDAGCIATWDYAQLRWDCDRAQAVLYEALLVRMSQLSRVAASTPRRAALASACWHATHHYLRGAADAYDAMVPGSDIPENVAFTAEDMARARARRDELEQDYREFGAGEDGRSGVRR